MNLSNPLMLVPLFVLLLSSAANADAARKGLTRVLLRDGQELAGEVTARDATHVTLRIGQGQEVQLPLSAIASIEETEARVDATGEVHWPDPSRTRYLYAPSAMMLKRGEGYFSQKELLFSSVAYGVTDHVTVLAGSALPLWFADAPNFILGAKVGFSPAPSLHVAAGIESLVLPGTGGFVGGLAFGSVTLGGEAAHVTVSGGPILYTLAGEEDRVGPAIVTLSGNVRVAPRLALVAENWIVPSAGSGSTLLMANAFALRVIGRRLTVDVGAMVLSSNFDAVPVPVPWLDFTYNFQ